MNAKILYGFATGAVFAAFNLSALAEVKVNPYHAIIDRNPFGLKPTPIAVPTPTEPAPASPEIELKLTGIGTLIGSPKAFIELVETKTKKIERLLPLAIGETRDGIEIVSIDPIEHNVRIRRGETETTLNFEKNGYKANDPALAVRSPAPFPGVPTMNSAAPPQPVHVPASPVRSSNVLVDGKLVKPPERPLSLEEARDIINLRREEMERNRPGSSIILPPVGTTLQTVQPMPDSIAPVRFHRR